MATNTTYSNSMPAFVADPQSMERYPGGLQIDFDAVDDAYIVASTGKKKIPAGTVMAQLASGKMLEYGGADASQSPPEEPNAPCGILATDANEDSGAESLSGYGLYVGGCIYENLLPQATGGPPKALAGQVKTDLGTAGLTFKFFVYEDNRT